MSDGTQGFNRDGVIEVRLPADNEVGDELGEPRSLLRCRVVPPGPNRSPFDSSPQITSIRGGCIAGGTRAVNAVFVEGETIGESDGVPGQEFTLEQAPVVISDEAFALHVHPPPLKDQVEDQGPELPREEPEPPETEVWHLQADFAESTVESRHFTLDRATGTIRLGPIVRMEDGEWRQFGAVPKKGSILSVPRYRVGGGVRGNVAANAISVLRHPIAYVDRPVNLEAGRGGVDGETVEEAKVRGPLHLRARNRAVTSEDFEVLTREAAPEIRRVRCLADDQGDDPSAVRVLVVPDARTGDGRVTLNELLPAPATCDAVQAYLDERRLVGTRVRVESPAYQGLQVKAGLTVAETYVVSEVLASATEALYHYFNPVQGGPQGTGWPFGRDARIGEAYAVLQQVAGVDVVEELALFYRNPETGDGEEDVGGVLILEPNELLVSFGHEVYEVGR